MPRDPKTIGPKYLDQGIDPGPIEERERQREAERIRTQWKIIGGFVVFIFVQVLVGFTISPWRVLLIVDAVIFSGFVFYHVLYPDAQERKMYRLWRGSTPEEAPEAELEDHPLQKRELRD